MYCAGAIETQRKYGWKPPAAGYTNAHARSRTHTQQHRSWLSQRQETEARLLYRNSLVFEGCCGTSEAAAGVKRWRNDSSGFQWAYLARAGRKAIPRLLASSRAFAQPGHSTRSPAGSHTCAMINKRAPGGSRSREREKRQPAETEQLCVPFLFPPNSPLCTYDTVNSADLRSRVRSTDKDYLLLLLPLVTASVIINPVIHRQRDSTI